MVVRFYISKASFLLRPTRNTSFAKDCISVSFFGSKGNIIVIVTTLYHYLVVSSVWWRVHFILTRTHALTARPLMRALHQESQSKATVFRRCSYSDSDWIVSFLPTLTVPMAFICGEGLDARVRGSGEARVPTPPHPRDSRIRAISFAAEDTGRAHCPCIVTFCHLKLRHALLTGSPELWKIIY
jgi:hypothetical protein